MLRISSCSASRKRSTRPATRTRSPRSKRPARTSASLNARACIAPVRSRSSNARYAVPERAVRRSLREHANTASTRSPARSPAIVTPVEDMTPHGGRSSGRGTVEPMQPLRWERRPDGLRAPALVCAFKGWNDAGESATSALAFVAGSLGADQFATIDPEEFVDFQATRPLVRLEDGITRRIDWPDFEVHSVRIPRAPRDLVLLSGPEPAFRWRTFSKTVVDLAEALGIQMAVLLGAL